MTDSQGEVSEVDSFAPDAVNYDDATPDADLANQTADGAPKNYGDVDPDESLR